MSAPTDAPPDLVLPTFLVVGAMKAGTTSLHRYLESHPQVFVSTPKEIDFFASERHWERGPEWYSRHFLAGRDLPARGEASTSYTKFPRFPECTSRIAALLPDVRVVYLLREPIDRLRSHYVHNVIRGWERRPPEEALLDDDYLSVSRYASQLERYLDVLPREQVLPVFSEDLRDERRRTVGEVLRFIGVDPGALPEDLSDEHHRSSQRREPRRLLAPLFRSPTLHRVRRAAPEPVRRLAGRIVARPVTDDTAAVTLSPELGAELRARLDDDLRRLAELVGPLHPSWTAGTAR